LLEIGSVVSEEKIFFNFIPPFSIFSLAAILVGSRPSPLKLLSQSQPNFAEMILGWSPFKFLSISAVLYPKWPPLLKIEISSNGQNCSIEYPTRTKGTFLISLVPIGPVVSQKKLEM
jgi:hypothetical protein